MPCWLRFSSGGSPAGGADDLAGGDPALDFGPAVGLCGGTLAGIDNQQATMISQVAGQLFSSGSGLVSAGQSAAGLPGQLYSALVQNDTTQAGNIGKAIATLASALNGKSSNSIGGINISTG
jgi:hypothetical protein